MKKILILVLLVTVLLLVGCQVSDKIAELVKETPAEESAEETEIGQGLDEINDLDQLLDEDFNFEEFEDLELE